MLALVVSHPRPLACVFKKELSNIPFLKQIVACTRSKAMDREDVRQSLEVIRTVTKEIQAGRNYIIYPEGTRNKDEGLLPFHNGVFKIAQRANAPIAVLCVTGTEKIHKRTPFRRTDVYLDVLEVLPAEQVKREKTEVIGAHVRDLLLKNIEEREHK